MPLKHVRWAASQPAYSYLSGHSCPKSNITKHPYCMHAAQLCRPLPPAKLGLLITTMSNGMPHVTLPIIMKTCPYCRPAKLQQRITP